MKCVSNCVKKLQVQWDYFHKVSFILHRDLECESNRLSQTITDYI